MNKIKKEHKIAIIYHSVHHKNTEKIAVAMADVLDAKLLTASEAKKHDLKDFELIGFGSGIYEADFHKTILEVIEINNLKDKPVFIFSTSGVKQTNIMKNKFNRNIISTLSRKQAKILGSFSCRGWDSAGPLVRLIGGVNKGRPNKRDLQRAREFAQEIQKRA
ncbi:flavodoxin [Candidatus Woesearchaeota archaeon]|nr:flavodoxin [Candidatus Woesearchaeota archaeon]